MKFLANLLRKKPKLVEIPKSPLTQLMSHLFPTVGIKAKAGMRMRVIQWNDCMASTPVYVRGGVISKIEKHTIIGGGTKMYHFAFYTAEDGKEYCEVVENCNTNTKDKNLITCNQ